MLWTAPEIRRGHAEPLLGNERAVLEGWLEYHRTTLLLKCAGLTAEQLAQRAVPPSNLSLLGLIRHLTDVERGWLRRKVAGQHLPAVHGKDAAFEAPPRRRRRWTATSASSPGNARCR